MKARILACPLLLLLASCSTKVQPFPELPLSGDNGTRTDLDSPGSDSSPDPGSPDGITDASPRDSPGDAASADVPEDVPPAPDAPADPVREEGSPDTPLDGPAQDACEPVSCGLWCEFGFAQDSRGCPVCACRDCGQDGDCEGKVPGCPKPLCSAEGACLCDCSGYEPTRYACPDGSMVPLCSCTPEKIVCVEHPEWRCPTLCKPGSTDSVPCPDGSRQDWCVCEQDLSCQPLCQELEDGSGTGIWWNPCTQEYLRKDPPCIPNLPPLCTAIGTRSEGWRDDFGLIAFAQCGPRRNCVPLGADTCVGTRCSIEDKPGFFVCNGGREVPFCTCDVPEAACVPECVVGPTLDQAWVDPCTGKPVVQQRCMGCTALCQQIGTKSEGWYSSCDRSLITYAPCGTGTWTCAPETPWAACTAP